MLHELSSSTYPYPGIPKKRKACVTLVFSLRVMVFLLLLECMDARTDTNTKIL